MFSANENILLRQHKRRVIEYIESSIPENALELGTTVMVMQVSCRQPGCVPLETAVTIVFPKPPRKSKTKSDKSANEETSAFPQPLIPGLEESRIGGSFKTRILKPLADVTQDDVLNALPPSFTGGRRTVESICLKARDTVFAQIGQLVGDDDTNDSREGRKMVAEYLQRCLVEYVDRGCKAPEWGEPFPPVSDAGTNEDQGHSQPPTEQSQETGTAKVTMDVKWGKGNIVIRRPVDEGSTSIQTQVRTEQNNSFSNIQQRTVRVVSSSVSSQSLLQQLSQSKHAPGIRRPGCPCCDPDSATTYADKMML
eukprot:CCRYP_016214-RA/>CCRYP_016214-RA protein AED:0.05 eAED:0.05 QI:296/1/1/1/0.5/0.33/3/55/309